MMDDLEIDVEHSAEEEESSSGDGGGRVWNTIELENGKITQVRRVTEIDGRGRVNVHTPGSGYRVVGVDEIVDIRGDFEGKEYIEPFVEEDDEDE